MSHSNIHDVWNYDQIANILYCVFMFTVFLIAIMGVIRLFLWMHAYYWKLKFNENPERT